MKSLFFSSIFISAVFFIASVASAQVLIQNPEFGAVDFKQGQLLVNEVPVTTSLGMTSTYVAEQGSCFAGEWSTSVGIDTETTAYWDIAHNYRGVVEFNLDDVDLPTYFTADNFTARLVGLGGVPRSSLVSLSIDLFDMTDEQENFVIGAEDYYIDFDSAVSINGDPYINGEFDEEGIDVTEQLRQDLFGDGAADGASSGFILMASGGSGVIEFPAEDAYLEINLADADSDTDVDVDSDTNVVDSDSHTGSDNDTDIDSDSAHDTGVDSSEDSETASGGGDSDYWETDNGVDTNDHDDINGEKVKCSCTTAGSTSIQSIFSLLF